MVINIQSTPTKKNEDPRSISIRNKTTTLHSDWVSYEESNEPTLCSKNKFQVFQKDKTITGASFCYQLKKGNISADSITADLDSISFLIKKDIKEKLNNKTINTLVNEPIQIKSKQLIWDDKTRNLTLIGNVSFNQDKQFIESDQCLYDDSKNKMIFKGNVLFKRYLEETIKTNTLIIDFKTQNFELETESMIEFNMN